MNNISSDNILGEDIKNDTYGVILKRGSVLGKEYIGVLKDAGVEQVVIRDRKFVLSKSSEKELVSRVGKQVDRMYDKLCVKLDDKEIARYLLNIIESKKLWKYMFNLKINDKYTYKHSINVAIVAHALCKDMGIGEVETEHTVTGALMHDIGKVMIPKGILNNCGRLSDEEMEIMRTHVDLGYKIVAGNKYLVENEKVIVKNHHEREDGKGYSTGLNADELDLGSKIVAVADVFDALISDRPYRSGMSMAKTLDIISGFELNKEIKGTLNHVILRYPVGSVVITSNNCIGVVEDSTDNNSKVRLVYDMNMKESINCVVNAGNDEIFIYDRIDNKINTEKRIYSNGKI